MSRVLIIGDTHCPVMRDDYPKFLKSIYRKYKCNTVVHIGDLVDWASISYHPKAPSLKNSEFEYYQALVQVRKLYKAFPKVTWLIGNHDALPERQATDASIPLAILGDYRAVWEIPGWKVVPRFGHVIIDGVLYQHGDKGYGGENAAIKNARAEHCSVVQGHHHSNAGVVYDANQRTRIFGMNVGCGIDWDKAAMDYGKKFNRKPILGCGVVIDGVRCIFEPMPL